MVMPWECKYCGHSNSDGDIYCENCQYDLWKETTYTTVLHKKVIDDMEPMMKVINEYYRKRHDEKYKYQNMDGDGI
jgi:hypothetical protein